MAGRVPAREECLSGCCFLFLRKQSHISEVNQNVRIKKHNSKLDTEVYQAYTWCFLVEYCWRYQNSLKNVRTTKIIIHTMSVDNSINLTEIHPSTPQLTRHPVPSSLLSGLLLEAAYFRHQLSQALTVNSSLIHHAKTLDDVQSIKTSQKKLILQSNTQVPFTPQIKIEHTDPCLPSISDSPRTPVKRQVTQRRQLQTEGEEEEDHDKNETKNIPKNYGKAMLSFIQKNIRKYSDLIKPILNASNLTVMDLLMSVRRHKKEVNSINYLKLIWGHSDKTDPIFKCIRILSYVFMRKHCLEYIFNSRIKNYTTHIKYRKRIMEGIQNTTDFTCIKQF